MSISHWNARYRRVLIASCLVLTLLATVIAAVARHPLDGSPVLAIVRRSFSDAIGAEVSLARVRLDLLLSRGLVVEDFELRFQSWTVSARRAVVRPDLVALLEGEIRPLVRARHFVVRTEAADGAEAMQRLRELLEVMGFPDATLQLSGGELITRNGAPLFEAVAFELREGPAGARFSGRAQQRGAGRLDIQGTERPATGELLLDVYLDGLATDDLRRWAGLAGLERSQRPGVPRLRAVADGYWFIRLGGDHTHHQHEFGLDITALELAHRPARQQVPRMSVHLTGRLLTEPAQVSDPAAPPGSLVYTEGSFVRADATVGRLRTAGSADEPGGEASRMLISGPLVATFSPRGRTDQPRVIGDIELDNVHVRLDDWFVKPCGTPTRVRLESGVSPVGSRVTQIGLELGHARAWARIESDGRLTGETDWIDGEALGQWFPALEHRISGGRARLVAFEASSVSRFAGDLELDAAAFGGRRMPLALDALSGRMRFSADGFEAESLDALVSGVPLRIDLDARVAEGDEPLRLSFAIRSDPIDLGRVGIVSEQGRDENASVAQMLPAGLAGFAQANLALLRQERGWLARVEVERGTFTSPMIRSPDGALRDVELELALRSLRLAVTRLSFRRAGELHAVSGTVDLNPLVPDVQLAARPN